ncbi:hypothetical protein [Marininema halotolerans]|uniref:Uncharacterized protein n=1 Tax=Marininema halotolerans TaxID=1155944 RepID=A0A1I6P7M0_9BACL|nr:hypothetical protein [Marininema halotolerans]SFS36187.1 hypothetical protein SAMN05444972_101412 [Marininema halotolerans]
MKRKLFLIAFTIMLSASLLGFNQVSYADQASTPKHIEQKDGSTYYEYWKVYKKKSISRVGGKWHLGVTAWGAGTVKLSKKISVANKVTGTVNVSYSKLTAALGYDVTKTNSTTASFSTYAKTGQKVGIYWKPVYSRWKVTQRKYIHSDHSTIPVDKYAKCYPRKYHHLSYKPKILN